MSNFGDINFVNIGSRKDIKVEKIDREKYKSLLKIFNLEYDKDLFILAMKVGYFYNLCSDLKVSYGKFNYNDIGLKNKAEMILISYEKNKDSAKVFDGATILETCEKYANGGIKRLYELFCESNKDEEIIIEDFMKEIAKKIK